MDENQGKEAPQHSKNNGGMILIETWSSSGLRKNAIRKLEKSNKYDIKKL